MKKETRLTLQLIIAATLAVSGLILLFVGLFIPPMGEIHSSVLIAYGEVSTFSGSLLGVDYHYRFKRFREQSQSQPQPPGNATEV